METDCSGIMWEQHCDKQVESVGFKPVGEEWQSCYCHPALRLFLVAYLDDLKMAGPKDNLDKGWSLLLKGRDIEPPVPIGVYLGCGHEEGTMKIGDITARTVTYNMEDFLSSCVDCCLELAGNGVKLRRLLLLSWLRIREPHPKELLVNLVRAVNVRGENTPFQPTFTNRRKTSIGMCRQGRRWLMSAMAPPTTPATGSCMPCLILSKWSMTRPKTAVVRIVRIMGGRPLLHLMLVVFNLLLLRF